MLIFNEVKIKYDHLDALLEEKFVDIRLGNEVNVIVDLKEVFRKFFRPNIGIENLRGRDVIEEMTSDIINIIGHYRNYFYKKGKYTSVYFLYSKSECELMKAKHPGYKRHYYDKYFVGTDELEKQKSQIVRKSVEALQKIIDHIPNSNFIDTSEFDEFIVASFLLSRTKPSDMNIILSNDDLMCQLISRNTFVLNIKGIKTKIMDEKNALSVMTDKETKLSIKLLPIVLSLAGAERYNLDNIDKVGLIKGISMVEKLVASGKLIDSEYVDFPLSESNLSEKDRVENSIRQNIERVRNNYSIIKSSDVLYTNTTNLTVLFNRPKTMHTFSYYTDLNSKIFGSHPLNLDMLLKGETLK